MERFIECFEEKFKVRYYFDPDVRELTADSKTGIVYKKQLGDIKGVSIYSSDGELLGSFEHIDFDNDEVIRKIIEQVY